jgi:predicted phosphodiesterase
MYDDLRVIMESCRFAQFGSWEGYFEAAGVRTQVRAAATLGARDRSWGVRPVGEPEMGAPGLMTTDPGVYWVWAPIDFGDVCTQFRSFEDREGNPTELSAAIVPAYASIDDIPRGVEPGHQEMATAKHRIEWEKGTRRPQRAEIDLDGRNKLLLFHGSPHSHMHDLLSTTPPEEIDRLLGGSQAPVMAGGHTHVQMLRQHRGALLLNPGSLGQPFKEYVNGRQPEVLSHAEYATVEADHGTINVTLRRVELDRGALKKAAADAKSNPLTPFLVQQYS